MSVWLTDEGSGPRPDWMIEEEGILPLCFLSLFSLVSPPAAPSAEEEMKLCVHCFTGGALAQWLDRCEELADVPANDGREGKPSEEWRR